MKKKLVTICLIRRARKLRERKILEYFNYNSYQAAMIPTGKYGLQLIVAMNSSERIGVDTCTLDKLGTTAAITSFGASVLYLKSEIFFNDWEIIDRRVLVEKLKCL